MYKRAYYDIKPNEVTIDKTTVYLRKNIELKSDGCYVCDEYQYSKEDYILMKIQEFDNFIKGLN